MSKSHFRQGKQQVRPAPQLRIEPVGATDHQAPVAAAMQHFFSQLCRQLLGAETAATLIQNNQKGRIGNLGQNPSPFASEQTGDISLGLQTKLLRLIETGTFRRVGGLESIKSDFRLITASHRNLRTMVDNGEFRNDLYYRISAFPLHIPSLKERIEDIPLLVASMLKRFYPELDITITDEAIKCLQQYNFPGNIRELSNIVQRATLMVDDEEIQLQHLPDECKSTLNDDQNKTCFSELITLKVLEKRYLEWASTRVNNKAELAKKLGVSERTLYRKFEAHEEA